MSLMGVSIHHIECAAARALRPRCSRRFRVRTRMISRDSNSIVAQSAGVAAASSRACPAGRRPMRVSSALLFLLFSCSATSSSSVNFTLGPPLGSYSSAHTVGVNLGAAPQRIAHMPRSPPLLRPPLRVRRQLARLSLAAGRERCASTATVPPPPLTRAASRRRSLFRRRRRSAGQQRVERCFQHQQCMGA